MPTTPAPHSTVELAAWSVFVVLGGRAELALLPVGAAGLRGALQPVATIAPSACVGIAAASMVGALCGVEGLEAWQPATTIAFALATLVVLARAALGPAGLVPRHPRLEAPLPLLLGLASAVIAIAMLVLAGVREPALALTLLAAAAAEAGLERTGLAPTTRRSLALCTAVGASAWVLLGTAVDAVALALAIGGGAFAAGWVRRADRRDLALAALLFAALALRGAHAAGLVGATVVLAATRRPRLALPAFAVAIVAIVLHAIAFSDAGVQIGKPSTWIALTVGLAIAVSARRGDGGAR